MEQVVVLVDMEVVDLLELQEQLILVVVQEMKV